MGNEVVILNLDWFFEVLFVQVIGKDIISGIVYKLVGMMMVLVMMLMVIDLDQRLEN